MNGKRDFSNTVCLIDADGTLFNSFVRYNLALDRLLYGKYSDRPYEQYYSEFNNTYDIIPGSPWKLILDLLVQFLGHMPLPEDYLDSFVEQFEDYAVAELNDLTYEDLAIKPVFDFCREFAAGGGRIVIHSGTNRRILEQMLTTTDAWDLFSGYLCTDMLDMDAETLGKWGYKTKLIELVKERHCAHGQKAFVLGDSKGDGFGAAEHGLPFVMAWRGYPKDPYQISGELAGAPAILCPDLVIDMREERIEGYGSDGAVTAEVTADLKTLLDWCEAL